MAKNVQTQATQRARTPASSRSKRQEILTSAIDHFGRDGYEYTKWADIAEDVGFGSTALYHYFESKLHCLFEIHGDALRQNGRGSTGSPPTGASSVPRSCACSTVCSI